MDKKVE